MVVVAFLILAALSAATWSVSVACFKATYGEDPGPAVAGSSAVPACAVGAVTLSCFVPFPAGYVAGLIIWAVAVYGFLDRPTGRPAGPRSSWGTWPPRRSSAA